jgi:hypothetical protein
VLTGIRDSFEVGADFTARDLTGLKDIKLHTLQNTLWLLSKKGYLDKPRGAGSRGRYVLRGRKTPAPKLVATRGTKRVWKDRDPDMVIIDRLLDAMANAEPIIKKWSKVHEALKGI